MHYYSFNIGDYRRTTTHLSLLEHGIYRALLDTYYLTEEPLCADEAKLMRSHSVRSAEEKEAFFNVLEDFFVKQEDGYHHAVCDEMIKKYKDKSAKAKASAEARWSKTKEKAQKEQKVNKKHANASKENANALQTECAPNADTMLTNNHKPITNNHKPSINNRDVDTSHGASSISAKQSKMDDQVLEVYEHWMHKMHKNPKTTLLSPKRKRCIQARIRDGYALEDIKRAIDMCALSAFHMGGNDNKKQYNDIELICRNSEKLEFFLQEQVQVKTISELSSESDWMNEIY